FLWRPPVTAWLVGYELVEIARAGIEMVFRSDDSDAQMAQRKLPALVQLLRVVEQHRLSSVDERHAARADDLTNPVAHDERRVFVDADAEEAGVLWHDEKQSLEPAALREVRVDDRVEPEKPEARPDVLLDEIAFDVHLTAGHRQLGERGGAGARAGDGRAALVRASDRRACIGASELRDQLDLIAAPEEHAGGIADHRGDLAVPLFIDSIEHRNSNVANARTAQHSRPIPAGLLGLGARRREADHRTRSSSVDEIDEAAQRVTVSR